MVTVPGLSLECTVLVLFAALGTGLMAFAAVTAMRAVPLLAFFGPTLWLFLIAGILSEWQTLEVSVYHLFKEWAINGKSFISDSAKKAIKENTQNKKISTRTLTHLYRGAAVSAILVWDFLRLP